MSSAKNSFPKVCTYFSSAVAAEKEIDQLVVTLGELQSRCRKARDEFDQRPSTETLNRCLEVESRAAQMAVLLENPEELRASVRRRELDENLSAWVALAEDLESLRPDLARHVDTAIEAQVLNVTALVREGWDGFGAISYDDAHLRKLGSDRDQMASELNSSRQRVLELDAAIAGCRKMVENPKSDFIGRRSIASHMMRWFPGVV